MKVKYKKNTYKCGMKDSIIVTINEIKLIVRRLFRRTKLLLSRDDLILYLIIVMLWLIFAKITNYIGNIGREVPENYIFTV